MNSLLIHFSVDYPLPATDKHRPRPGNPLTPIISNVGDEQRHAMKELFQQDINDTIAELLTSENVAETRDGGVAQALTFEGLQTSEVKGI